MPPSRRLLVLSRLDPEQKRVLGVTATANKLELDTVESVEAALTWLDRGDPRVVVFDTSLPRAEKLCAKIRSKKQLARVPIIGLTSEMNDALAPKFFSIGADDLIPKSLGAPLMTRLRAMPKDDSLRPPADRGKAVVADSDRSRGDVFGRVLANAGYDVKYALDRLSLEFYTQQSDLKLIVATTELGDPKPHIQRSRKSGSAPVWIVTAPRRDLEGHLATLGSLDAVRVMPLGAPPEDVLFTSNELLGGARHARSSARILYGTVVAFRDAGADDDELGFSYNVSAGGVYVRTLAPAPEGRVWLELRPPRSKSRVRLEGRVAWKRSFFDASGATSPPGFGVELVDGLGDGLEAWREAYAALAGPARPAPAKPEPPEPPPSVDVSVRESTIEEPIEELGDDALRPATEPPPPPAAPAPRAPPPPPPARPGPSAGAAPVPAPVAPPPRARSGRWLWPLVVLGALAGAAAALVFSLSERRPEPTPHPAPPPAPPLSAASATAVRDGAADAAGPEASVPEAAAAAIDDGKDGSELNWNQGYLLVESPATLDVYATGVKIGETNQQNLSRCGLRYVRLGKGDPPSWQSPGQTVDVKCQAVTRVAIEPESN